MNRHCFALDLINDPILIREYERYHEKIWPEITDSLYTSGITALEIYRIADRLFMIMEVNDNFSFEQKAINDANNEKVQEWEQLMWKYQKGLPNTKPGVKWVRLEKIFDLAVNG
jgi:L-rhamnose mutarotase